MDLKVLCDRCKREFDIDEYELREKERNKKEVICWDCEKDIEI